MEPAPEEPAGVTFGRFRVLPHRRELLADGRPIKLGGRAFDVLMALVEARGAVVSKNALMARVWPDRIVEENNLQWQISALRAAFGADRNLIRTVSGRGYQFAGQIGTVHGSPETDSGTATAEAQPDTRQASPDGGVPEGLPTTNLPQPMSELIGRDDELQELLSLVPARRLITLTGAGGIGKTRLAVTVAHRLLPQFPDGVWLAEFSSLTDPGLVPASIATAVGLDLGGEVSPQRLSQALVDRRVLLVLDTCEHVIGAAAVVAEAVLQAGPAVGVIATSRESLRAEGEQIYPVPPLAVPPEGAAHGENLARYGAVQLFIERARAAARFAPGGRRLAMIAAICRQLDGMPLAIELAAAHASALGIEALAARLDDRFRLLTGGRRTALPRHQTLRATLDWSYELLPEPERIVLRRLAIFTGVFTLEAAAGVVADNQIAALDVVAIITSLVAKSLLATAIDESIEGYRLLDTTRAYTLEKLVAAGERERLARRHAEYYREVFERAKSEREKRPAAEWLAEYGRKIDNLRGDRAWGSHLCLFYETKEDLLEVASGYFKAGFEAGEYAIWEIPDILTHEEAREALSQILSGLGRDLNSPSFEIRSGKDVYCLSEGRFDRRKAEAFWNEKLTSALAQGFAGIRMMGDAFWLDERAWKDFYEYEMEFNNSMAGQPMSVLCAYPLAVTGVADVFDVARAHHCAIAKRNQDWEVVEMPALKQAS
jgi:predicted ATPase/DNA-binding winged helix-turn-helix (wHTH) protein